MDNKNIAKLLRNIAAAYSIKDENKHKFQIIAYQKASDTIANLNAELKDLFLENQINNLPGIGSSMKEHLDELFRNGKVTYFEEILSDISPAVFPLLDIPSFGPKKAYKIVDHFNLKNESTVIEDVKKLALEDKIAQLPTFGVKSQADILRAITEYRKGTTKSTRMVLPYAMELAEKVLEYLRKSPDVIEAHPLGSLRRMKETVGDIDISASSKKPKTVIDHFINYPNTSRIIEKGDVSASILVNGGKQVDLMIQSPESYGSLLQHFTGSKDHNVALREYALKKGLSLSEYGIKSQGKPEIIKFKNETDFYNYLGLDFIPPEIRENKGEINLSLSQRLPRLVEPADIHGDLHLHSNFPIEPSHDLGGNSFKEMRDKANSLGYEYIGFSEHNPSISKHSSIEIYNLLIKRDETIEQVSSSNSFIRLIKLLEVDILASGKLALDDKSLDLLDGVIVSIHSSFSMSEDDMTTRIINGLSHKKAKILAHPTGRILNSRPGYKINWPKLFDFMQNNNKALEINSWPTRLDLPDYLIYEARKAGIKFVINTDSHASYQMDNMFYGVSLARRGWCTKDSILNTLDYDQFIKWLSN